jgi:hypothetical protein
MDREGFLETIRKQYAEDIQEAYLECEHDDGRSIDMVRLNLSMAKLMQSAQVDGLPPHEFEDLVRSTLPDVAAKINFPRKKAA